MRASRIVPHIRDGHIRDHIATDLELVECAYDICIHVLLPRDGRQRQPSRIVAHIRHGRIRGYIATDPSKPLLLALSSRTLYRVLLGCDPLEGTNCKTNCRCGCTPYLVLRYM